MTFGQANGAHFNMYATRTDQNTERKTICILQTETYFFQTSRDIANDAHPETHRFYKEGSTGG